MIQLIFKELKNIYQSDRPVPDKVRILYQLQSFVFLEITKHERLYFSTLFARMAYVGNKMKIDKQIMRSIHRFRRVATDLANQKEINIPDTQLLSLGMYAVIQTVGKGLDHPIPEDLRQFVAQLPPGLEKEYEVKSYQPTRRVLVTGMDKEMRMITGYDLNQPADKIQIRFDDTDRNEPYLDNLLSLDNEKLFPISVNLLEVEIDREGIYHPRAFIFEPDFLVDITAIAECFKPYGTEEFLYFIKKFKPRSTSHYILLGNIANYFLDLIVSDLKITFEQAFASVFKLDPLAFALMNDRELKELMAKSKAHFFVLKKVIADDLPKRKINVQEVVLEPSFFSEKFGIQGRLDLFYYSSRQTNIIELKSGKPYMTNTYGLNINHYIQTLLYDLLVKSVYGSVAANNFILYSSQQDRPLRYAPVIRAQQDESLRTRNEIVIIEKRLLSLDPYSTSTWIDTLKVDQFPKITGFSRSDFEQFVKAYQQLNASEKTYFKLFVRFIATEHHIAKTGIQGAEQANGMASLWLNTLDEKESRFEIISHLEIMDIQFSTGDLPVIQFSKTKYTNPLANFRQGDIVVLYPQNASSDAILVNQIYKGTIVSLEANSITIRLRNQQVNRDQFSKEKRWNLERDLIDSSFNTLYRGLFAWANTQPGQRNLLMGIQPPRKPENRVSLKLPEGMTDEQKEVCEKIVAAKDYYLLWGPPGTGKTSVILKNLCGYYLEHTSQKVLLLAYTNRAVDEMCAALESLPGFNTEQYLRIGSRYSTAPDYRDRLLSSKMEKLSTRQELLDLLKQKRIIVSTIASLSGKMELFKILVFDLAIVDEASQILDPGLIGILPRMPKWILIGDHKQLPAVVAQASNHTVVKDELLNQYGIRNLSNSLFERLIQRSIHAGWEWAGGKLTYQGRMHRNIMEFPSQQFYGGSLKVLNNNPGLFKQLTEELQWSIPAGAATLANLLATKRVAYLPTQIDMNDHQKTNIYEAEAVVKVIQTFQNLHAYNNIPKDYYSIGVITPYRAQIALIIDTMRKYDLDPSNYSIDTVERYQGGARDIVIISLCTNQFRQLETMISKSDEGVDRKLNVALTRARFHLVIIGNLEILSQDKNYRDLLNHATRESLFQPN